MQCGSHTCARPLQVKLGGGNRGVLDFQAPGGSDTSWVQVGCEGEGALFVGC